MKIKETITVGHFQVTAEARPSLKGSNKFKVEMIILDKKKKKENRVDAGVITVDSPGSYLQKMKSLRATLGVMLNNSRSSLESRYNLKHGSKARKKKGIHIEKVAE